MKEVKKLRNKGWQLPSSRGVVKHSTRNTVGNAITLYGTMCVLDSLR